MAKGTPGYPGMGTDLNGNPLPPIYKDGKVVAPPKPKSSLGAGAVDVLTHGRTGETIPSAETPVDVGALRAMLVKQGYNIPEKGNTPGPLFKAALKDFLQPTAQHPISQKLMSLLGIQKTGMVTGLRNPDAFNAKYGLLKNGKVNAPTKPPVSRLTPSGDQTPADIVSTYSDPSTDPPAIDLSGLGGLVNIAGKIGGEVPLISTSLADKLAGFQYDSKIRDLGIAGDRQTRDAAQALHDISHWYGQAEGAQTDAAGRDHAISQAGEGSVRDAVAKVVASLGGSANQGSGLVGAAGADAAGTLAALGANEDQYNTDLAPLLKAEAAGQTSRQIARNTSAGQDIQNQIIDAQGERGGARAQALMQILGENGQRRTANNQLDEQRFQNQLALEQAREAAALTGAKIIGYTSKASQPPKPAKGSFGASSTGDRTNFTKDVLAQIAPNGQIAKGMTRTKAIAIAQRLAAIYFPHGGIPNGTGLIKSIVGQAGF